MSHLQTQSEPNTEQQKQAVLRRLLQKKGIEPLQKLSIPRRKSSAPCPLSFAQERLWFLDQLEPQSTAYNLSTALRIRGLLRPEILKRSFNEVVRRHEILRTAFTHIEQQTVQVINPSNTVSLPIINLQHLPPDQQESEVQHLARAESSRTFNLAKDCLFAATLLQLNPAEHILLFTLHHIISDGWSSGILCQEIGTLYQAFSANTPSSLPELSIQYADFALWQREWLQGEVLDTQLRYWSQQLKDAPTVLELPIDHSRPAIQSANGAMRSMEFSLHLSKGLKTLAHQESATLYMALLATFKVLLYRYTGQTDILVGSAIANRNRPELEGLIGFFVNTLVLRTQLSGRLSFRELLAQVRKMTLDAYEHQDLPFEKLVAELNLERNLSYQPLFQVAFELQNRSTDSLETSELTFEALEIEDKTAKYDLTLFMSETAQGLIGAFEYNTDLFEAETITRMLGHYQTLLEGIITHPDQTISTLPLLTDSEQYQHLVEWNNTDKTYSGQTIHQLFEKQVERMPDAIAIICETQSITYQALNTQANQIAHYLISLGVKEDVLVGLCFEKSVEMIAALLGILKAGGAYVPIDPAYPQDRVAELLEDSQLKLVLTQQNLAHQFKQTVQTISLNAPAIALQSQSNPSHPSVNKHLSYIIYTSGSTGKPKGVMIEHRSLVNYTQAAIENYGITEQDSILQFASISFDAAAEEIFPALVQGATLILRTEAMLSTIPTFLNHCREYRLSVLDLPTAFWHLLVAEMTTLKLSLPESIRLVIIGGEAASAEHLATWLQIAPDVRLVNSYGPTEATIVTTICNLCAQQIKRGKAIPIGKPIPNVQVYVLDEALQPVPIGVPGELYISGAGLARGYLYQPELTAKFFISHPFSTIPDARLYKTGDRVCYRSDGNLEFLGRLDEQVKIRGFRIELGEIEALLNQQIGVKTAFVSACKDDFHAQRLVAYIVPNEVLEDKQVSQWQTVFDDLYNAFDPQQQSGFYVKGWESSYDQQPIPDEQVQAWMEQTVQRIKQLNPNRVLELGCGGSGLMLLQLAPHCTQYWATDPSANALNILQQQLQKLDKNLPGVTFTQRSADDFTGVKPGSVDTILIVSVAQYFPSIHYLVNVLEKAVEALEPGGRIFLGDVRNLTLLEAFYTSLELGRSSDNLPLKTLQQNIQQQLRQEKQLVIDPEFFFALKAHLPKISHVEILLERGLHHNELTQFRYDVILQTGDLTEPSIEIPWLDWQAAGLSIPAVHSLLTTQQPKILGITNVPNARVSSAVQAIQLLNNSTSPATIGVLRQNLQTHPQMGIDPEHLWHISETLPYSVDISWSTTSREGQYNVIFKRHPAAPIIAAPPSPAESFSPQPWRYYANAPQQTLATQQLVGQLRSQLKAKLPSYMMPSAFICLESLPLTPNGKIDHQALPLPEQSRPELEQAFTAPRSSQEIQMAQLWAEVLGLEQIGIHDNFFELGGHSLLTTQLILKVKEAFQVDLPLRILFESPTIASLVENIQTTSRSVLKPENKVDLQTEAILDASITPEASFTQPEYAPTSILLTGATGFLGAFLLYELLQQTQATVYCLVRSSSLEAGYQRIRDCLKSYLIWQDSFETRIIPILGDLSLPLLGITDSQFQKLASQIDIIYHNGAWVHHIYPYSVLKAANVSGTKEVIKLACQTKSKPIHFISTLNVFSSIGHTGTRTILENDSIDHENVPDDGYIQTKWVAERLIKTAAQRGLPVSIYRPGRISGHSQTGVFNPNDFLYRLIIGCVQMGSAPEGNLNEDIIPIDYASQAIMYLSQQPQSLGQAFHLVNPQLLNVSLLREVLSSCGYSLPQVPYDQWRTKLIEISEQFPQHSLSALLPFFSEQKQHPDQPHAELQLDTQNTLNGLAGSDIVCPSIDASLLKTYIDYLVKSNALPLLHTKLA